MIKEPERVKIFYEFTDKKIMSKNKNGNIPEKLEAETLENFLLIRQNSSIWLDSSDEEEEK